MVVMVVHGGDAVWLVLKWMCIDGFHQMFWTVNKCFLLQSTDVCEQILRVVSRSNRLEELVLENAGLRTWVFSWICEYIALCHLPFWSVHDLLKKIQVYTNSVSFWGKKKPEWTKKKKKAHMNLLMATKYATEATWGRKAQHRHRGTVSWILEWKAGALDTCGSYMLQGSASRTKTWLLSIAPNLWPPTAQCSSTSLTAGGRGTC